MRKQTLRIVATLSLFMLCACVGAQAQSNQHQLKASIPFSFQIGRETLPAGDYTISFVNPDSNLRTVLVKSNDGHAAKMLQLTPVEAHQVQASGRLVFNRYGADYFLTQVWTPTDETGLAVRRSRAEREMQLGGYKSQQVDVKLIAAK
jgi:hypothetical protein